MQKQRKAIGQILVELGRITPDDVERTLEEQRARGGYFGDALVRLGLLTRDELHWALAGQFEIPYVQLKPDSIDRSVAALVPAAWAREHLVLPVLRAGDAVTAVLGDVGDLEKLDEVRRFTGAASVEAALASPQTIRVLIEAVHGDDDGQPVPLERLWAEAVELRATLLGVSVRPGRVTGWYRRAEGVSSRPLGTGWAEEMEALVSPLSPLATSPVHAVRSWPAILTLPRGAWRIECHALGRGDSVEWTATLDHPVPTAVAHTALDAALRDELRAAAAAGGAVVHARADGAGDELLEAALPGLPAAVLGAGCRAIHLSDRPVAITGGLLYVLVRGELAETLERIAAFGFEALTLDVDRLGAAELEAARRAAPLVAFRARAGQSLAPDGIALRLTASGDGLAWTR
ncbi:MAG TPA: hypothetical protein VFQ45_00925 [Longimicrobium sp.]|nr:hypothetical protein [Longimicrobium sp.]